ncbi:MAG: ABC-2 transporter permease [Spirochaetaceae bacterium]
MQAVFYKEFKHYFTSLVGYVFLSIQFFICGFIFTSGNLLNQSGDIKSFFSAIFSVLVFLIPLLTMRQFSEERKMKTHQLLFTLPLSTESIVLGKYLATLAVAGMGLATTFVFPLILFFLGVSEPLLTLGNYVGIALLLSAVAALGLFLSSLSENQVISAIITYTVILFLWLFDSIAALVLNGFLVSIVKYLSLRNNYVDFTYGIFNPAAIVFYLIVTAVFLLFTVAVLDSRRQ